MMNGAVRAVAEPAEILDAVRPGRRVQPRLTGRQKAAIVVRVLLADGAKVPLTALPDHVQAALTEQIGSMRLVDRTTLNMVVEEFIAEIEEAGVAFPGGIDGAISLLDGHISATAANRLRRLAGVSAKADPWERIATLPPDRLLPILEPESVEVGAVMLSKLSAPMAASLLERLPGERARRIAHAMSRTGAIDPETVRRIGLALACQLEAQPHQAFEDKPDERVGAILNSSPAATRDSVLKGLTEDDPEFAEKVRKAIFTFEQIPERLGSRDVPKAMRQIDQQVLLRALKAALDGSDGLRSAAEFILGNLTQRAAENLRAELQEMHPAPEKENETALSAVVSGIRQQADAGELMLVTAGQMPKEHGAPLGPETPPLAGG